MSNIIEDYSYDIFIRYRQKDNKGDRWVSEFVEASITELGSTNLVPGTSSTDETEAKNKVIGISVGYLFGKK